MARVYLGSMSPEELEQRIAALPEWARQHIDNLEQEKARALEMEQAVRGGMEPTHVWFEPSKSWMRLHDESKSRVYIDAPGGVKFTCQDKRGEYTVTVRRPASRHNELEITLTDGHMRGDMAVKPECANSIIVRRVPESGKDA